MRSEIEFETGRLSDEEVQALEKKLRRAVSKVIKEEGLTKESKPGTSFITVVICQTLNDTGHRV